MNFTIDQFNPTKKELTELAIKYKGLEIKDENDSVGYAMVDTARKDLKEKRVFIKKTAKEMRDDANKFAKEVIALEKELVAIIEPLENDLQLKQIMIDNKRELPLRIEELKAIFVDIEESVLLKMNAREYKKFYDDEKMKYFEKKEQERIEAEREKERKREIAEAKKQAREQEKAKAKEREEQLIREAELEKQRIIQEQKDKEEAENRDKEEKIRKENEEKERIEKNKKYKEWVKSLKIKEEDLYIKRDGNTFIAYKVIGSITIK